MPMGTASGIADQSTTTAASPGRRVPNRDTCAASKGVVEVLVRGSYRAPGRAPPAPTPVAFIRMWSGPDLAVLHQGRRHPGCGIAASGKLGLGIADRILDLRVAIEARRSRVGPSLHDRPGCVTEDGPSTSDGAPHHDPVPAAHGERVMQAIQQCRVSQVSSTMATRQAVPTSFAVAPRRRGVISKMDSGSPSVGIRTTENRHGNRHADLCLARSRGNLLSCSASAARPQGPGPNARRAACSSLSRRRPGGVTAAPSWHHRTAPGGLAWARHSSRCVGGLSRSRWRRLAQPMVSKMNSRSASTADWWVPRTPATLADWPSWDTARW